MVYTSTLIVANSFLNIIAAVQDTEIRCQSSSNMNAVKSVLVFRMYFFVEWTKEPQNLTCQTLQYLKQTPREVLLNYLAFSNSTRYTLANVERYCKVEHSKNISLAGENIVSLNVLCNFFYSTRPNTPKDIKFTL